MNFDKFDKDVEWVLLVDRFENMTPEQVWAEYESELTIPDIGDKEERLKLIREYIMSMKEIRTRVYVQAPSDDDYLYASADRDGSVYVYTDEPERSEYVWTSDGNYRTVFEIFGFTVVNWKETLVELDEDGDASMTLVLRRVTT